MIYIYLSFVSLSPCALPIGCKLRFCKNKKSRSQTWMFCFFKPGCWFWVARHRLFHHLLHCIWSLGMISDDWEWWKGWSSLIYLVNIWKRDYGEDYRIWVFVGKWVLKIKQLLTSEIYFSSSLKTSFYISFLWNLSFVSLSPSARPWGWKLLSHDEEYFGDGGSTLDCSESRRVLGSPLGCPESASSLQSNN